MQGINERSESRETNDDKDGGMLLEGRERMFIHYLPSSQGVQGRAREREASEDLVAYIEKDSGG